MELKRYSTRMAVLVALLLLMGTAQDKSTAALVEADPWAQSDSFQRSDHIVATSVFHWYSSQAGQLTGPWRPIDGRANWTGEPQWWQTQLKQMMTANIDALYVHLIPHMDQQRANLLQALSELRRQGYRTPKVAPFLDPIITWNILPTIDLATPAGKDNFVEQYERFFEQYFSTNTDPEADDYLMQIDNRIVLDTWHTHVGVQNPGSLTRSEVNTRLAAVFGDEHPVFNSGIHMVTTANNALSFADEQVHQFQIHAYFKKQSYGDITSVQLKGGYWDQNIRDPGYILSRDGGSHYDDAWAQTLADPSISRVYIESWNEYDEGSGIYAADLDPYIRPGSAAERLGSNDTWSHANEPYQYIRATADGARQFNQTPDLDAAILAHDFPQTLRPGETREVTVLLRNEGDLSWIGPSGANPQGYAFAQHDVSGQVPLVDGGTINIDNTQHEIPIYGGVFRGRPITMQFQVTAPNTPGVYDTSWQMRRTVQSPQCTNETAFNWHENTENNPVGEQGPGLVTHIETSEAYPGDSPMDALGAVGGIEANTFIFRDNGVVDNGNQIFGDGEETMDYIRFETEVPVSLDGYTVRLPSDYGLQNEYRSTALVRFSVDGQIVDFFDNDGHNATCNRMFGDGPVSGSEFLMEFTRVTTGGPRIAEIDAILAEGWPPQSVQWFGQSLQTTMRVLFPGDANEDGYVNVTDLSILATNYGAGSDLEWSQGDFTADGVVDASDLGILSEYYGNGTMVPEPIPGDANRDGKIDVSDLGILATYYDAGGGHRWGDGDFTGDGFVDVNDLGVLASYYGEGSLPSASVPETSTITLLVCGLASLLCTIRRK